MFGHLLGIVRRKEVRAIGASIIAIAAGGASISGSSAGPQAFGWGSNQSFETTILSRSRYLCLLQFGQLGIASSRDQSLPAPISMLDAEGPVLLAAGGDNSAALTRDGKVYTWGRGSTKALGLGGESSAASPQFVSGLKEHKITHVAASSTHVLAVNDKGQVFSWGNKALGRSGSDLLPALVEGLPEGVVRVAAGKNHSLALTAQGQVFSWGEGKEGALGLGSNMREDRPRLVTAVVEAVSDIAAGAGFSLLLGRSGCVYSCGSSDYGQTAQGTGAVRYLREPEAIRALGSSRVVSVAAGEYHAACATEDGHVFSWGMGADGQMGDGLKTLANQTPVLVQALAGHKIRSVACGGGHTAALTEAGELYMWGRGRDGQLGLADHLESVAAYRSSPRLLDFFRTRKLKVKQVSLGSDFSLAIAQS